MFMRADKFPVLRRKQARASMNRAFAAAEVSLANHRNVHLIYDWEPVLSFRHSPHCKQRKFMSKLIELFVHLNRVVLSIRKFLI